MIIIFAIFVKGIVFECSLKLTVLSFREEPIKGHDLYELQELSVIITTLLLHKHMYTLSHTWGLTNQYMTFSVGIRNVHQGVLV